MTITLTGQQASTAVGTLSVHAAHVGGVVREAVENIGNNSPHLGGIARELLFEGPRPPLRFGGMVRETFEKIEINHPHMGATARETLRTTSFLATLLFVDDLVVTQFPADTTDRDVTLRWSDDGGASWSNGVLQSLGNLGQYDVNISFRRLGHARTRVWEITWSSPVITAMTGAWLNTETAGT